MDDDYYGKEWCCVGNRETLKSGFHLYNVWGRRVSSSHLIIELLIIDLIRKVSRNFSFKCSLAL